MRKMISVLGLLMVASFWVPASMGQVQDEVLTNADIVMLTDAGVPAEAIVNKINSARTNFDTSVEQLVALSKAGVDASVMAAMTEQDSHAESDLEADTQPKADTPSETDPAQQTDPPQAARPDPVAPVEEQPAPAPTAVSKPLAPVSPMDGAPVVENGNGFSDALKSGGFGPEMVVIPAGRFRMGCVTRRDCFRDERPLHRVVISQPLAVSRYAVTFEEYDRFAGSKGPSDEGWGRGARPVINVSWQGARTYAAWLSRETGERYRLLSEAEWEYAARAGTETKFHFGDDISQLCRYANHADAGTDYEWRNTACSDGVGERTAMVGSYAPNAFGLYDMHGNVWEWVEDCWKDNYRRAPRDGSPMLEGDCSKRVLRGGAWGYEPGSLRSAFRTSLNSRESTFDIGFRVARALNP